MGALIPLVREDKGTEQYQHRDKGYKLLFSHPSIFIDFARNYLETDEFRDLTVDQVKPWKSVLVDRYKELRIDVFYEITRKEKTDLFFLLEVQSNADQQMAYRIGQYVFHFWAEYLRTKNVMDADFRLPRVVPCVLYTGDNWTAEQNLKDLVDTSSDDPYSPDWQYLLVSAKAFSDENLLRKSSVLSSVFFLEKSKGLLDYFARVRELRKLVKGLTPDELTVLLRWQKGVAGLTHKQADVVDRILRGERNDMLNMKETFMKDIERLRLEGRREGLREGLQEGLREGLRRAKTEMITNLVAQGYPDSKILEAANITSEELKAIKEKAFKQ